MSTFEAFRVHREADTIGGRLERIDLHDLSPGDVVIDAAYSSVNYKDALGATGAGKILTRFPLVAGVDVAGTVESSEDPRFRPGDRVLVTGYDFGVGHDGGYAGRVRVPAEWVVPVPPGLTLREAMALGSAGLTVALCVKRFEDNGQAPSQGAIVVTGASGGVGSLGVDVLSGLGYEVVAVSGKPGARAYLERLGATRILDRHAIDLGSRPLEKAEWAGAIDNVGGDVLAWLTRTTRSLGNICSVGLVGGSALHTTVMPFILRGVSLLGITSAGCPSALRHLLWRRLGTDLRPRHLEEIAATEIGLEGLPRTFQAMLKGEVTGRILVRIPGG